MKKGNYRLGELEQRAQDLILEQLRAPEGFGALNRALEEGGLTAQAMTAIDLLGHLQASDPLMPPAILQKTLRWAEGRKEIRFEVDVMVNGIFPIDVQAKVTFGFRGDGIRFRMPAEHRHNPIEHLLAAEQVKKMQTLIRHSIMTGERAAEIKLHNGLVEVPAPRLRQVKFKVD